MHKNKFEKDPYNGHQNFLYNRALYGLSMYAPTEIAEMSAEKKKRIIRIHKKAQSVINLWKQEIVNSLANKFFTDVFPTQAITKCLNEYYGIEGDINYVNNMSFRMLKISKKDIITKLIEKKVLPKNFNELNNENRSNSKWRCINNNNPRKSNGRGVVKDAIKTAK